MKKFISAICAAALLMSSAAAFQMSVAESGPPRLISDSSLILTESGDSVCGTGGTITAADLAAQFEGAVSVVTPAGEIITGDALVPTGSTVVSDDGGVIPVIVSGDANADGEVDLTDAVAMLQSFAGWDTEIDEAAAVTTFADKASVTDVVNLLRFLAGWDVRLGAEKIVVDEDPQTAAHEDAGAKLWFDHSTEKLARFETRSTSKNTFLIYSAKNELESANMYISPDRDLSELSFSVTPFTDCYGHKVRTEIFAFYYISMDNYEMRPDPLMPVDSTYVPSVKAGESHGFLVRSSTDADTTPGLYEATVSIYEGESEIKRAKVYLHVWDFILDDADAPETSFGLSRGTVVSNFYVASDDTERAEELYKQFYDYFLENRINAYFLPYQISDPRADEYIYNPRVRSFLVGGQGYGGELDRTDEQIISAYEKLSADPALFNKGYFYYVDEPLSDEKYNAMRTSKEYVESIYPGGKCVVPLATGNDAPYTGELIYDLLYRYCDIYCPRMSVYTPEKYRGLPKTEVFLTPEDTKTFGTYDEIIHDLTEKGEKVSWWYFAGAPFEPYVTYHADSMGVLMRIAGWQQKQYDVTGCLYYATNDYRGHNPYRNILYTTGDGRKAYGNGILVYPGNTFGVDGPIGSIRTEHIRDGFEDYMYLVMAERLIGTEKVDAYILRITRDLLDFDPDSDLVYEIRCELGALLESLSD